MKNLKYLFLLVFLGFTSCMREDMTRILPDGQDKVDIYFNVKLPDRQIGTKAMADNPQITNFKVAVFGSTGFLKEYVDATQESAMAITNGNGEDANLYTLKVSLSLTDNPVRIHFIANGPNVVPFQNEDVVIASLSKSNNEDAYWQRIEIPTGIRANKDGEGNFIDYYGNRIDYPVVSNETKAFFNKICLIRNFAKIVVEDASDDFTLLKYAVVFKPKKGSIAPYDTRNGGSFVMEYETKDFAYLRQNYPGYLPVDAEIETTIPANYEDGAFVEYTNNPGHGIFMYERPVPTKTMKPSLIILYGLYDGDPCYYALELVDNDGTGYYPIFRNFRYTIKITSVVKAGASTISDAINSASSGDVSAIPRAEDLNDISDGDAQLFVEYTEKTLVGQENNVSLKFKYIPDFKNNPTVVDNSRVSITNVDGTPLTVPGEVIYSGGQITGTDQEWATFTFNSQNSDQITKTQVIKIQGENGHSKLYRKITYKLINKQNLEVECKPAKVPRNEGEELDILIKIPKTLPQSMFPLQLKIESDQLSISPAEGNLPVYPGETIVDDKRGKYYQFIKTLSWTDYEILKDDQSSSMAVVTCHFKTTKKDSACDVYVVDYHNKYFNKNHGSFINYDQLEFPSYSLTNLGNGNVQLKFEVYRPYPTVTIKLVNLEPVNSSTMDEDPDKPGTYYYTPTTLEPVISLKTLSDNGNYSAELSAEYYKPVFIASRSYIETGFTTGQQTRGKGQNVGFAFNFETDDDIVLSEKVYFTLNNLTAEGQQGFVKNGDVWEYTPTTELAHNEITFKTLKFADDVSVSMRGHSYNSVGPITLPAPTLTIGRQKLRIENRNHAGNVDNNTVYVHTETGKVAASYTLNSRYNNADFVVDLTLFDNEYVYLAYEYTDGNNNTTHYYSAKYTLTQLEGGLNNISFTTTRPW